MHLTIDIGNTATKIAVFQSQKELQVTHQPSLTEKQTKESQPTQIQTVQSEEGTSGKREAAQFLQAMLPTAFLRIEGHNLAGLKEFSSEWDFETCIVSSTANITEEMRQQIADTGIEQIYYFNSDTPIPIQNLYSTPKTLGPDRLAAAIGAYYEGYEIEGKHVPILIIDSGSAITYDFVNEAGEYLGGNISPGVEMRFRALHEFTAKLPLIHAPKEKTAKGFMGDSTETAIQHGVMDGVRQEIEGFICQFMSKYPNL